jgi:hypothetical protein
MTSVSDHSAGAPERRRSWRRATMAASLWFLLIHHGLKRDSSRWKVTPSPAP